MKVSDRAFSSHVVSSENMGATRSPAAMADARARDDGKPDAMEVFRMEVLKIAEGLSRTSKQKLKFDYREEADAFQITVVDEDDGAVRKNPSDSIIKTLEDMERLRSPGIDAMA